MPITRSAKKALKQSDKKKILNLRKKRALKGVFKDIDNFKKEGNMVEVEKLLPIAYKAIDKAAKGGVIKKNTADRKKSRLTKSINKAKKK